MKEGTHEKQGFANSMYAMSKVAVTAFTGPQQTAIDADKSRQDILINCVSTVTMPLIHTLGNQIIVSYKIHCHICKFVIACYAAYITSPKYYLLIAPGKSFYSGTSNTNTHPLSQVAILRDF